MNSQEAHKILRRFIREDNHLEYSIPYLYWGLGDTEVILDGRFTSEELSAIAWWVDYIHLLESNKWFKTCKEAATFCEVTVNEFIGEAIKDKLNGMGKAKSPSKTYGTIVDAHDWRKER